MSDEVFYLMVKDSFADVYVGQQGVGLNNFRMHLHNAVLLQGMRTPIAQYVSSIVNGEVVKSPGYSLSAVIEHIRISGNYTSISITKDIFNSVIHNATILESLQLKMKR